MRNALLMALALTAAGCSGREEQPTPAPPPAAQASAPTPAAAPQPAPDTMDAAARRAALKAYADQTTLLRTNGFEGPPAAGPGEKPQRRDLARKRRIRELELQVRQPQPGAASEATTQP
jgi:hypothetical protein